MVARLFQPPAHTTLLHDSKGHTHSLDHGMLGHSERLFGASLWVAPLCSNKVVLGDQRQQSINAGAHEPHRSFEKGSGLRLGKSLQDATVPSFLPDTSLIRSDILDYYVEIEHFDRQLGAMLEILEEAGELENTLVIVTSDNGMAFPRAKANCFEYGFHVPLAIRWPAATPAGSMKTWMTWTTP